jgi:hypothetical protein
MYKYAPNIGGGMSNATAEKKEVRSKTAISESRGLSKNDRDTFSWLITKHDPLDSAHDKISVCVYCLALQHYWKQYWGEV